MLAYRAWAWSDEHRPSTHLDARLQLGQRVEQHTQRIQVEHVREALHDSLQWGVQEGDQKRYAPSFPDPTSKAAAIKVSQAELPVGARSRSLGSFPLTQCTQVLLHELILALPPSAPCPPVPGTGTAARCRPCS